MPAPTSPPHPRSAGRRRRLVWMVGGGLALVAAIVAGLVFQPWLLFVDVRVADQIPRVTPAASAPAVPEDDRTPPPSAPAQPVGPRDLSTGTFVSHEHTTSGSARVILLPDGRRQLALEGLSTSNGPDVRVWLSAGPVIAGEGGWYTAADHPHVELGPIKGNLGDQLYDIPDDVDLAAYPTVSLWCVRFGVSFGAAALTPSG